MDLSMAHFTKMQRTVLWLVAAAMIINMAISVTIEWQRNTALKDPSAVAGTCFANDPKSGCFNVQTSPYAKAFGISNPLLGIIGFGIISLAIVTLLLAERSGAYWLRGRENFILLPLHAGFIIGSAFSIWLLYLQFFVLMTTCSYCLWVDAIMISSSVAFFAAFWK